MSIEMAAYCFDVIQASLRGTVEPTVPREIPDIERPLFVTWKKGADEDLRGCIGTFSDLRLSRGLNEYAKISAFQDTRFRPITLDEIPSLHCGVSILVDFEDCTNYNDWQIGTHGVRMRFNYRGSNYSAVFLPEVMPEQGWNHVQTIDNLIKKSGFSGKIDENLRNSLKCVRFQSQKFVLSYNDYVAYKNSKN
ncbi:unnamed protein product [Caenorhabditis angaria]|uniref:AMMECR1 domain-containing protein n=1 Tax=Caenorhabditis angaria TaxID=860376 RepID=A0A9P1IEL9_9PELO|nr:unnamed protein product [Caenorhabditis angaria]